MEHLSKPAPRPVRVRPLLRDRNPERGGVFSFFSVLQHRLAAVGDRIAGEKRLFTAVLHRRSSLKQGGIERED